MINVKTSYSTIVNGEIKTVFSKTFIDIKIYKELEILMKNFRKEIKNNNIDYFSEEFQRHLLNNHFALVAPIISDLIFSKKILKEYKHFFTANDLNLL